MVRERTSVKGLCAREGDIEHRSKRIRFHDENQQLPHPLPNCTPGKFGIGLASCPPIGRTSSEKGGSVCEVRAVLLTWWKSALPFNPCSTVKGLKSVSDTREKGKERIWRCDQTRLKIV